MFKKRSSFTPPTCTLEITSHKPVIYLWLNQDIFEQLKFKLSLDDPRIPRSQQVTITGDRQKLEELKIAVDNYVQNLLTTAAIAMPFSSGDLQWQQAIQNHQPYLQRKGLAEHNLFLANFHHDSQQEHITLSTVQLFDLISVLDSYQTQVTTSPTSSHRHKFPFTGAIAGIILVTVGIIALWLRSLPNLDSKPSSLESSSEMPKLDEIIPPDTPDTANQATPKPKVGKSISSWKKLPPPPAVDTPKPKPDIPDPADYSLPQVARQSGFQTPPKAKPTPNQKTSESVISIVPKSDPNRATAKNGDRSSIIQERQVPSPDLAEDVATPPSQAEQIQTYFAAKWQPPKALKQSLEYRIYLNQNGSIKRVVPIGKASGLYLSQTKIPVGGEPFIAPLSEQDSSIIRLLFNPDGGIKTFREFDNKKD